MKDQTLLKYLRKCIQKYDLIRENDKIAVGLSGGKDSIVLLYGLYMLKKFYPKPFDLIGITVDPGFSMDYSPLSSFMEKLDIPFFIEKTQIYEIVFEARKDPHPCGLCSNMRRAALTEAAEREKCTVLALGHHRDDYLSTLFMSLIYEGNFYTFAPSTEYEDRKIRIIRPMLYVPEGSVTGYVKEQQLPVLYNPCPADKTTKRREMEALLTELKSRYPEIKDRLLHAIETSDIPDWVKSRDIKHPESEMLTDTDTEDE